MHVSKVKKTNSVISTLTENLIRNTILILGRAPLDNLNSSWHGFHNMKTFLQGSGPWSMLTWLLHTVPADFAGALLSLRISHSTTSQRCYLDSDLTTGKLTEEHWTYWRLTQYTFCIYSPLIRKRSPETNYPTGDKSKDFPSPSNQMCPCLFFCAYLSSTVVSFHWGLLGDAGAWTECTLNYCCFLEDKCVVVNLSPCYYNMF